MRAPSGAQTAEALTAGPNVNGAELRRARSVIQMSGKPVFESAPDAARRVWSGDNRTAGYRLVGADTPSVRIECRVGGADLNPYLAFAAQIAAGIDGIERGLELEAEFTGDAYGAQRIREIPKTLRDAVEATRKSKALRAAMGDEVVEHYLHAARWEQAQADRIVTDWEVARGFERA